MFLCDVALGRCFQVAHGKFIDKEDLDAAGYQSTKGCGRYAPAPGYDQEIEKGLVVPLGKETRTPVLMSELKRNEYVIYDVNQIRIKYVLKVKFIFD